MSNARFYLPFLGLLLSAIPAKAGDAGCVLKTAQDVLRCALAGDPEIRESELAAKRDGALIQIAKQRINPEIETKVVTGNAGGDRLLNTETTLFHTVEIGGKRRARIREAEAEAHQTRAEALKTQESVALHTVLALNRLRQIQREKELLREAAASLESVRTQFRSKPLLSPEQEVSSSLIGSGSEEMKLKSAFLSQEEAELQSYLETATGVPYAKIRKVLPGPKKNWPLISKANDVPPDSSQFHEAIARKKMAEAKVSEAKGAAWPDLRIGPTVETDREADDTNVMAGGSVSLPLPLLSWNRGAKSYARLEEKRANLHQQNTSDQAVQDREIQRLRYREALAGLRRLTAAEKENPVQSLTERGLISGSLLLEFNRQRVEVASLRHQQELIALEALWKIAILDGRLMEEKL